MSDRKMSDDIRTVVAKMTPEHRLALTLACAVNEGKSVIGYAIDKLSEEIKNGLPLERSNELMTSIDLLVTFLGVADKELKGLDLNGAAESFKELMEKEGLSSEESKS